jgi:hypothetical protein
MDIYVFSNALPKGAIVFTHSGKAYRLLDGFKIRSYRRALACTGAREETTLHVYQMKGIDLWHKYGCIGIVKLTRAHERAMRRTVGG